VDASELPRLAALAERAAASGVPARMLTPTQAGEYANQSKQMTRTIDRARGTAMEVPEAIAGEITASGVPK
jgi:hypothetical protein